MPVARSPVIAIPFGIRPEIVLAVVSATVPTLRMTGPQGKRRTATGRDRQPAGPRWGRGQAAPAGQPRSAGAGVPGGEAAGDPGWLGGLRRRRLGHDDLAGQALEGGAKDQEDRGGGGARAGVPGDFARQAREVGAKDQDDQVGAEARPGGPGDRAAVLDGGGEGGG